ncbi:amidohydrolase family protein [Hirsutella rhossiliensis]|uniref:Amidohydrolase family domain-containing protein n=1 Tax=Hirsutella rhossiliensis TaxID=111463 RepID=A0A9P8N6X1_9HYPO|nr:amidohydrolase family domain-containing protein [Hirsutella rhossiliensis]KAH0967642.1 amidohydrolase family domain-containing protein [Hirsutella rhossiliensis]
MPTISITNADVFDGLHVKNVPNQCFQGSPGNILAPQSNSDVHVDGTGCTLMPGLIDAKVDANSSPGALYTCAAFGITTVIDSSSTNAECQAMHLAVSENPTLPSYFATGSAIGPENASSLSIFSYRAVRVATTPAEARQVVAENVSASSGGNLVKIIVDQPGLDFQTIAAAVAAAHEHGSLAVGQASQCDAYKLALDAGFDVVTAVPVDGTLDAEVVRGFAQKGIGVVPTLCYLRKAVDKADNADYDFAHAMAAVKQLHEAGVRICAGTSANQEDSMTVSFGQSLHEELKLLAEAGLTNMEVMRAATCVPSALFRLPDRGAIEVGYRADLLLVSGNPLENLALGSQIRRVWIAGVEIDIR